MERMNLIPCFSNHSLLRYRVYNELHFLTLRSYSYSLTIVACEKESSVCVQSFVFSLFDWLLKKVSKISLVKMLTVWQVKGELQSLHKWKLYPSVLLLIIKRSRSAREKLDSYCRKRDGLQRALSRKRTRWPQSFWAFWLIFILLHGKLFPVTL